MTEQESKKLKTGDAVMFNADSVGGVVVSVGNAGVRMVWDDGQEGVISHDHMECVSRATTSLRTVRPETPVREPRDGET